MKDFKNQQRHDTVHPTVSLNPEVNEAEEVPSPDIALNDGEQGPTADDLPVAAEAGEEAREPQVSSGLETPEE